MPSDDGKAIRRPFAMRSCRPAVRIRYGSHRVDVQKPNERESVPVDSVHETTPLERSKMNNDTGREAYRQPNSDREEEHAEMPEAGMARSGIREVSWSTADGGRKTGGSMLIRAAAKAPAQTTTTNAPEAC